MEKLKAFKLKRKTSVIGAAAAFDVIVDGRKVGSIVDGEEKTFEITPENHTVQFGYGSWVFGSTDLSISQKAVPELECGIVIPDKTRTRILRTFIGIPATIALGNLINLVGPEIADQIPRALVPPIAYLLLAGGFAVFVMLFYWFVQAFVEIIKIVTGSYYFLRLKSAAVKNN